MTQAQIDEALGRPIITAQHVAGLFGQGVTPEQQMQALQSLIDGAARYGYRMSQVAVNKSIQDLRGEYDPRFGQVDELTREHYFNGLFNEHGHLKEYRSLVEDAAAEVTASGVQFKDRAELQKAIIEATEKRIKVVKPDYAPPGTGQQGGAAAQSQATQDSPSQGVGGASGGAQADTAPGGNRAGAGSGSGGSSQPSDVADIWGD